VFLGGARLALRGAVSEGMDRLFRFSPPGCPRPDCRFHRRDPPRGFCRFLRLYSTLGHPEGIPLYFCFGCERSFSARRFLVEFHLHKPQLTPWAIDQLVSSVSLRQAARHGKLSRASLERRLRRFGNHGQRLLRHTVRKGPRLEGIFQMDEAESFERSRLEEPLTLPVLIERESRLAIAAAVGTLTPRGSRRAKEKEGEKDLRRRRSQSNRVVARCLERLVRAVGREGGALLMTDQKPSYPAILRRFNSWGRVKHARCSGKLPRGKRNPLFPINHTLAMIRDGLSRLRRRTWCHSKRRLRLWQHLGIYFAWKNFVRVRFNGDQKTPAQFAKVVARRWSRSELVRWRLDLGPVSISPLGKAPAGA
jgi:hypothetical protein